MARYQPHRPIHVRSSTSLIAAARPGLVGTVGPRFFGFVIGGALPAATAADLLAAGWDQCAYNEVLSPAAAAAERAAGGWAKALLGLPETASVGFVTGAQAANTVGLAVGRQRVLADVGWDVARDGLFGAPRVAVVASEERHATIDRAARLLGFGTGSIEPVAATSQGAIDVDRLRTTLDAVRDRPVIVCLQAGNVNTGACDDLRAATTVAHEHGAWVHVDGAFGLWAAASPGPPASSTASRLADSWGTDAHKWLNVPYDCGLAFCADAEPACCHDVVRGGIPHGVGRGVGPRPRRSDARVIKTGKGIRGLGRPAGASARTESRTSSTGRAPWRSAWPNASRPVGRPSTTTSSSTRCS